MNGNKKQWIRGVVIVLLGGILFLALPQARVEANLFQNFFNQYLKPLAPKPFPANPRTPAASATTTIENIILPQAKPVVPYAPTIDYEEAVVRAVDGASPAVVSIVISKDVPIVERCPYNPFGDLPPEFQDLFGQQFELYEPCERGTQKKEVGGGSGFIITSDGLIVTNKHVVLDEGASYTVFTNDGRRFEARVLARHPALDLAVLKISANGFAVVRLGDSNSIKLGQTAIAIGNALGEFRNTVSVGAISGLSRSITASGGGLTERIEGLIQTDAAINSGNSGGPLLNLKGEVIGINTAMVSGAQNIGFAIPVNQIKKAIESVKKTGVISTPYLGVRYLAIIRELKEKEKLPIERGVLLRGNDDGPAVLPNSPAEKAGLKAEDIILEVQGEKVTLENSLGFLIQKYGVGETIRFKILRGGKEIILRATLEERPKKL